MVGVPSVLDMTIPAGPHRFRRPLAAALLAAGAALLTGGGAIPVPADTHDDEVRGRSPAVGRDDPATRALDLVLGSGHPDPTEAAQKVGAAVGYAPVLESGRLARGDGSCSSPVPLPSAFEPACRVHDLGYDLLRAADSAGYPLPRSARRDLDRRLGRDLAAACEEADASPPLGCGRLATVAYVAVRLNSLRQDDGVPVDEGGLR